MDFALTALFITIFVDQWMKNKDHIPAIIGVAVTLICLLVFGSSSFLIPSMIIILGLIFIKMKKEETSLKEKEGAS